MATETQEPSIYQFSVYQDTEEFECPCDPPCQGVHRRHTGYKTITFESAGKRFTADIVPGTDRWEDVP